MIPLNFSNFYLCPQWKDDAHMYILAGFSTAFTLLFFFEVSFNFFLHSDKISIGFFNSFCMKFINFLLRDIFYVILKKILIMYF